MNRLFFFSQACILLIVLSACTDYSNSFAEKYDDVDWENYASNKHAVTNGNFEDDQNINLSSSNSYIKEDSSPSSYSLSLCGESEYDPSLYICENGELFSSCNSVKYDANEKFCGSDLNLHKLCGGDSYEVSSHFCQLGIAYPLCNGLDYDAEKYICKENELKKLCNGTPYDSASFFCGSDLEIHKLCGGDSYEVSSQFCQSNIIYSLCNGIDYNAEKYICKENELKNHCFGSVYDSTKSFCGSDKRIYSLCGETSYDVTTQFCAGSKIYPLCAGNTYDVDKQFCSSSKIYDKCNGASYDVGNNTCKNGIIVGIFTDSRDNKSYQTVTLGKQTWMAQNLNYAASGSLCYNDNSNNCTTYGRLYPWYAAMGSSENLCGTFKSCSGISYPHQGVCPSGWHLPTHSEWQTLFDYVDANNGSESIITSLADESYTKYNGTNRFLFSALPAGQHHTGYYYFNTIGGTKIFKESEYFGINIEAVFWTSDRIVEESCIAVDYVISDKNRTCVDTKYGLAAFASIGHTGGSMVLPTGETLTERSTANSVRCVKN